MAAATRVMRMLRGARLASLFGWTLVLVLFLALAPRAIAADERTVPVSESVLREAVKKRFSPAELARHDGSEPTRPILMAVRGIVFDVSGGSGFYSVGARYHAFAGRDRSRAVALMSLDAADLTDDCSALSDAEWEFLARILRETYLAKYPVVGHLAGGAFYPNGLCCEGDGCGGC